MGYETKPAKSEPVYAIAAVNKSPGCCLLMAVSKMPRYKPRQTDTPSAVMPKCG